MSRKTIINYETLNKTLRVFSQKKNFELMLFIETNLSFADKDKAYRYHYKFYKTFKQYILEDRHCYDNYFCCLVKSLKTFYSYLKEFHHLPVGDYHKAWYCSKEQVVINTLNVEQLKFLIFNQDFESSLPETLREIKDVLVFGCTVALRFSDLMTVTWSNVIQINGHSYLKVRSQKTSTNTTIKLPGYIIQILVRNKHPYRNELFQTMALSTFNLKLRKLAALFPFNYPVTLSRMQNGKLKNVKLRGKSQLMLSDIISSHIMRRTAITSMLTMGMPELLVKKISGHSPYSRDFYRYIEYTQSFLDSETDFFFNKMISS